MFARFFSDYGMLFVLLLLGVFFSMATWQEQYPGGTAGGETLAREIGPELQPGSRVLIVVRSTADETKFAEALQRELASQQVDVVAVVRGEPYDARQALGKIAASGQGLQAIAATEVTAGWGVLQKARQLFPALGDVPVLWPYSYYWPNFLKADNLRNIANQIAIMAIMAIGMTMVIIAGGIDLSVGSLVAMSAVAATWLIREAAGAESATAAGLVLCCLAAIVACGLLGLVNGWLVTWGQLPAFLATLGMMQAVSGLAFRLSQGQSIYHLPDTFVWLGRGADLGGIPNTVLLMLILYVAAHLVMTQTTLGRYIYAVGGNPEAARLSGVPVGSVLLLTYVVSAMLAGLGGVVLASQLKSGSPTYGQMYELYVIAAAVIGGTSLSGGEGKIFGTLIGALVIAVVQNGMNLLGIESYSQRVVLGVVILLAMLLDRLKKRAWGQ